MNWLSFSPKWVRRAFWSLVRMGWMFGCMPGEGSELSAKQKNNAQSLRFQTSIWPYQHCAFSVIFVAAGRRAGHSSVQGGCHPAIPLRFEMITLGVTTLIKNIPFLLNYMRKDYIYTVFGGSSRNWPVKRTYHISNAWYKKFEILANICISSYYTFFSR